MNIFHRTTLFHHYTWIAGAPMPVLLESWNRYSIAVHFTLALIGVTAVCDLDSVVISGSGCDFTKVAANE
jgi:hypothetical protein